MIYYGKSTNRSARYYRRGVRNGTPGPECRWSFVHAISSERSTGTANSSDCDSLAPVDSVCMGGPRSAPDLSECLSSVLRGHVGPAPALLAGGWSTAGESPDHLVDGRPADH